MNLIARSAFVGISVVSLLAAVAVAGAQKPAMGSKSVAVPFSKVVKIVSTRCIGCHHGEKAAAGIDLSSFDSIMKSKFKGKPVVVAKNVKASVLVSAIHGTGVSKMPPGPPLSAADVKTIEGWIAGGAKK